MTIATAEPAPPPPKPPEHNRIGINFRAPMPRPPVRGIVIDFHNHILAAHHGPAWIEAASHYGIDRFVTMGPLEEVVKIQRDYPRSEEHTSELQSRFGISYAV